MREDLELGVELFALLLGHTLVVDLLTTHDEAVILASHLADDAERAMTCDDRQKLATRNLRRGQLAVNGGKPGVREVMNWALTNLLQCLILVF